MHHHLHLFWLACGLVAALAVVLLLRLGFKRQVLSPGQRAKADAGVRPPDLSDPAVPAPPLREPEPPPGAER